MSVSQGPVSWTVRRLWGENRVDEVRMYVHQLSETCSVFGGVQITMTYRSFDAFQVDRLIEAESLIHYHHR